MTTEELRERFAGFTDVQLELVMSGLAQIHACLLTNSRRDIHEALKRDVAAALADRAMTEVS